MKHTPESQEKRRWPPFAAAAVLILFLGINLVTALLRGNSGEIITPKAGMSGDPFLFSGPGETGGDILVATRDNTVILFNRDMEELASRGFNEAVLDMKRDPVTGYIYIATTAGNFYTLDGSLEQVSSAGFPGRLVSFDFTGDGGFYLINGMGNNSPEWYLLKLDSQSRETGRYRTGIYTTKVTRTGEGVAFATYDGFVVYLNDRMEQQWRSPAAGPVSGLAYSPAAETLFAIDNTGTVTAFDDNGGTRWSAALSPYRLNAIAVNGRGMIMAADSDGGIFILDSTGKTVLSQHRGTDSVTDIQVTPEENFYAACSTGNFFVLDAAVVYNKARIELLTRLLRWINPALVLGFAVFLILSFPKSTAAARNILRRTGRSKVSYLFILPAFVLMLVFCFYPIITAFVYSFLHYTLAAPPRFVGFDNFVSIFRDQTMRIGIGNMFLITVLDIVKYLTMPLLVAELIFWLKRERNRRLIRTLFVIPSVVPGVVSTLLWKNIYNSDYGLINSFLRAAGLGQFAHAWMAERGTAIWSVIFVGFPWVGVFQFLVLMGGLLNIPAELYEAAKLDGANVWQRFWKIDIPMLKPQIGLLLFFSYIGSIQGYQNILLLTQGGPGYATYVPAFYMYRKLSFESNFGYASAIGVVLFIVVLAGTVINRLALRTKEGGS
jgi:ABC-type sugar transport system permease subunit